MIRSARVFSSFAAVLIVVGILGMASYINSQRLLKNNAWVIHTHEVLRDLEDVLLLVNNAETGQRGFILTGNNRYLEPYDQATGHIQYRLVDLAELTRDNPAQQTAVRQLKSLTDSKLDEMKQTIELRRNSGQEAAMRVILTDRGEKIMDGIRELVTRMQEREQTLLQSRQEASAASARWTMWAVTGAIPLSLLVLAIAAIVLTRSGVSRDLMAGPPEEVSTLHKTVLRYVFAVIAVALASLLRAWLLKLGPMPLFITYYPTVLCVALVSGGGPSIVTTILADLVVVYYFIPPYRTFVIESPSDVVALAIFTGTSLILCIIAERLRNSRWAEAFGLAKQQEAEELARKNEELAEQSEELSQQSEELSQQNEELQSQSEEIQSLNAELVGREGMLRKLLDAARYSSSEESVLHEICVAAKDIFGPPASAVVICERKVDELFIRAKAGMNAGLHSWPIESSFPGLVIQEGRTACLNDTSLRPDLKLLPAANTEPFRAALSSPLHVAGKPFGAVTIYSHQKQEWTTEQFRLVEWLAAKSGHILETLRLQAEVRESEDRLRFALDTIRTGSWDLDLVDHTTYRSPIHDEIFGYKKLLPEWTYEMFLEHVLPDDREEVDRHFRQAMNTGGDWNFECRIRRADGEIRWIWAAGRHRQDAPGVARRMVGIVQDITQRKLAEETLRQSEARLRLAMDAAQAGTWEWDLATNENLWSPETFRLYGLDPNNCRSSYETWRDIIHPEDRERAEHTVHQASRQGIELSIEWRVRMPDGLTRWLMSRGQPTRDNHGNVVRYLGIVLDITQRKLAEESLARAKDRLEQRVAERTAELAQRAAQLRALAGELTLSEQRERSRLAKVLHDHLQQLLVAAKFRLASLDKGAEDGMKKSVKEVEELIDESIASSRSLTAELSPPILHESGLNAGLEWLARRMADRQGLLVDLELEEIRSVPDDLKILLFESVRELLFNVAKHARTPSSAVSLRQVEGSLQLVVSDQGVGFDPSVLSRAGESGTGFGLFSVRERLELFGGTLEIQSAPHTGSRIFLSVPMPRHATAEPRPAPSAARPEIYPFQGAAASGTSKKTRVLLADDHAVVRQGIRNMLSNEQTIEVIGEAADGEEAVELARRLQPDVILMDISMPRLNGVEATRIIHRDFPGIRIIGLSMFSEGEQAMDVLKAGAVQYISKSGATEAVIKAIRACVPES